MLPVNPAAMCAPFWAYWHPITDDTVTAISRQRAFPLYKAIDGFSPKPDGETSMNIENQSREAEAGALPKKITPPSRRTCVQNAAEQTQGYAKHHRAQIANITLHCSQNMPAGGTR